MFPRGRHVAQCMFIVSLNRVLTKLPEGFVAAGQVHVGLGFEIEGAEVDRIATSSWSFSVEVKDGLWESS